MAPAASADAGGTAGAGDTGSANRSVATSPTCQTIVSGETPATAKPRAAVRYPSKSSGRERTAVGMALAYSPVIGSRLSPG